MSGPVGQQGAGGKCPAKTKKEERGKACSGQRERCLLEEEEEVFKWGFFWSIFLKVKEHESVYQRGK